ncbi:Aste57867_7786 [Aphanomyces stellatus]|uniref:Aste57867_7786 protein n=1 Tax=Aphanomyces stellatus TaxID=120398 RepID=A0A485KIS3_9STRA|nr:hypothetical protein As57867_007756 [Aphanomyces stellatus]VFT84685.1 Aste57867_7786 [Aphanomyces stellatus]
MDPPVEIQDGNWVQRQNHSFTWATFMDVTHPVNVSIRLSCVEFILTHPTVESSSQELLRELAFSKDQHGREVLQITDASTRKYIYDRLFFCGRYDIFQGPPVYVSSTAVVVMAYDHGICAQVFHEHKNTDGGLDIGGFINCNKFLGRVGSKIKTTKDKKLEEKKWQAEFQLWDKDANGSLSEEEYLRYCGQYFGGKLQVAMKFMKNGDEFDREIGNRKDLDSNYVLSLLPSVDQQTFENNLTNLKIHGDYTMSEYPHVMVMPAADRSLEDIYLKERPGENERRILLQQVAEGLQHLHDNDLVHGDVKKLNVVRVGNRLKLIDLDATTTTGDSVGVKYSSGSLPPELFYKLKSDDEIKLYCKHWANENSTAPELWERVWQKVKPKNGYVVKTFHNADYNLPYTLIKAHPSMDAWAYGVLVYQMYSGEELVSTDFNQDVLDDKMEQAATWTQEKLNSRIQGKISNALVRDLLEKLLVVDYEDRISMDAVLEHAYFKVDSTASTNDYMKTIIKGIQDSREMVYENVAEIKENILQMGEAIDHICEKLDYAIDLTNEGLKKLAKTK